MREKWEQSPGEEIVKHRGKVRGIRGLVVMHSTTNERESIVFTFREIREDIDAFFGSRNMIVASFLEKARPSMEGVPERSDYTVVEMAMQ